MMDLQPEEEAERHEIDVCNTDTRMPVAWPNLNECIPDLCFEDSVAKELTKPLSFIEISVHPSKGFLYIAHGAARTRLNKACGVGAIRMFPTGETTEQNAISDKGRPCVNHSREYRVFIRGYYFGVFCGSTDMRGNKPSTSQAELEEAIKSDVWKSVAKELGVGTELGDPVFSADFKSRHCKLREIDGRRLWSKNADQYGPQEPQPDEVPQIPAAQREMRVPMQPSQQQKTDYQQRKITTAQANRLHAIVRASGTPTPELTEALSSLGLADAKDVLVKDYQNLCSLFEKAQTEL